MYMVCTLWCMQDGNYRLCVCVCVLLRLQCCMLMLVMVPRMGAHEPIGLGCGQATEVCDWHRHLSSGDAVCPPASIEVHSQAGHRHIAHERIWAQRHLHPLWGALAVLDPTASPTPTRAHGRQVWAVEAPLQEADALRLSTRTEIQRLLVAQGSGPVYALQGWEVIGVQTASVVLVADSGHTVAKGCDRLAQR